MLPNLRTVAAGLAATAFLTHSAWVNADASSTRANALKLDSAIQVLKMDELQFERDATLFDLDHTFPAYSRVAVYLGVRINNLLMQELRASIDGGEPVTITYNDAQGRALFKGSNIDRLLYVNLAPGPHRLHIEYTARYDRSNDAPIKGSYDAFFEKKSDAVELELTFANGRNKNKPAISLKEWRRLK